MLRVLFVHNRYVQRGGEDSVLETEVNLMEGHGHQTKLFLVCNTLFNSQFQKIKVAYNIIYSKIYKAHLYRVISDFKPGIVHIHNFFPFLTPSVYDACRESGIPAVQTLHNYRTICPGALLMRDGKICEKCIASSPYQAVLYRCYRNSIPGSWAVARMVAYHRKKQTWKNKVDRFIALTQFSKQKFVQAGFPEGKIAVKPNFYRDDRGIGGERPNERNGALFVGRLSVEKGVSTMLTAWQQKLKISLRIAGDGPLFEQYKKQRAPCVEFIGRLTADQISLEMRRASFLVMPSVWYEGFPMVLVEAFANGLPVVASRLGSMAEIVEDGITGLHFEPGNPRDLAEKARWMFEHPEECGQMGENARKVYEEKYTPETNYQQLMTIYRNVIEEYNEHGRV